MAGYIRQSNIANGNVIDAGLFNDEYNDLAEAFVNTTGHKHDGTANEGPVIELIGDAGLTTPLNKILVDTTNKHIEFYTDVSSAAVQQLRIEDGAIVPILDNDIDLGTGSLEFKDGHFDGTVNLDTLVIGTSTGVTSVDTDLTTASGSDDTLASAKAIKTYVDSVPVGDLTAIVAGSGLTGTSLSGPIPTLNVIGGTGITANADDIAIDSSVVTLTDTQILSAKTLTSPVLNTGISGTAFLDEDNMASDSATKVSSQQSIKAYVDSQVATANELSELTDVNITSPADAALLFYDTGTSKWIDNVVSGDITIADTGVAAIGSGVIVNADINSSAAIDASKIADGSVSDAEFQRLDGLTSDIQTQLDLKAALASPALTGNPTAPTQSAGNNSTRLATTAYVDNSTASRDQLGELTDVTLASEADANYFIYDNAASVWKNKAISGAFTSTKEGVTTLASGIDATKIADGTVTDSEFQFINSLSANAQTQIDSKQATIDSSNRLNANLVGDGSVDNTEFGYLNGVTSGIQSQLATKASAGFAVAMAIAL